MLDLGQTPVVVAADVTRVVNYWIANSTIGMYVLVPNFLQEVANGQRPATADAVVLAQTYWDSEILTLRGLVRGS